MKKVDFNKSYASYVEQYRKREAMGAPMSPMYSRTEYERVYRESKGEGRVTLSRSEHVEKNIPRAIAVEQQKITPGQMKYARLYANAAKEAAREAVAQGQGTEEMKKILDMSTSAKNIYQNHRELWAVINMIFPSYENEIGQIVYPDERKV